MRMPTRSKNIPSGANGSAGIREAVSYTRVSSKEQELGYSIDAQANLFRAYAADLNVTLHEFSDAETAKTVGRSGFAAMVEFLRKHPSCRTLLVEKTDRLYRNLKDQVTIDELNLELHLVKENSVLTPASRPAEKFMHGINVLMAKQYIDNLSEEVKKGLRTKATQNLWPSFAPLGYRNTTRSDGKGVIVPDPEFGPIVTKIFEWFATGEHSLKSLARKA